MAGLTVDFHTMSLSFGTAAYAFDDEEDEYEDDEEDDDDDDDDDGDDDFSYYMDYIADGGSSADYYTDIEGPQSYWGEDNPYTPEDESVYYGNSDSDSYNYSSSDEDCTFCGMNNVNDFVNYIESGQAARDGITGHVFTDPHEFTSYASEHQQIMDAVISSGGSFDYDSCDGGDDDSGYSSSGSSSESTESGSHNYNDGDGANDSGTSQGHGNTNADANNGVANDSGASQDYGTQNQNLLQTDQERIDATKSEIINSNLTIKEEGYDASTNSYVFITYDVSKVEKTNVDGISVVNYEPAYGKVSVELSPRESNTENTETATPVSETPSHHSNTNSDVSNDDSNDNSSSNSVNYSNGGNSSWNSGDSDNSGNNHSGNNHSGNTHNGNSNSWNYGNSGNSGNSGNNHSGNSGDSGSIETISADDEGEYEPTDNTPSTTEPEPTPQEQPEYKEPEKDSDCSEESIQMSQQVSDLYNQELFADSFNELKEATKTDTEKIFTIAKDSDGKYQVSSVSGGEGASSYAQRMDGMISVAHSHPQGHLSCFSVSDLYSLAAENMRNDQFSTIFVVGEYATYAMQVTDAVKLSEFIDAHPRSEFVNPSTGGFVDTNDLYHDFRRYAENLAKGNLNIEDVFTHAMAMFLFSHDIGVSMMKAEVGEDGDAEFKELKTKGYFDFNTGDVVLKASECQ